MEYDHLFKLLFVGNSNVGKTSILLRFAENKFQEDMNSTIGVDLKVKYVDIGGKRIKLTIWDTAGQERFRTLTSSYYRGAQGVILVYDVTSRKSFQDTVEWLKEIDIFSRDDVVKLLIGNKIDLDSQRTVSTEEGRAFARANAMLFMECSAKTEVGVQQAFQELISKILEQPSLLEGDGSNVHVQQQPEEEEEPSCCPI